MDEPRALTRNLELAPGANVEVRLHLSGELPSAGEGEAVDLTYQFTASAR
jgi:hypothetical protein